MMTGKEFCEKEHDTEGCKSSLGPHNNNYSLIMLTMRLQNANHIRVVERGRRGWRANAAADGCETATGMEALAASRQHGWRVPVSGEEGAGRRRL